MTTQLRLRAFVAATFLCLSVAAHAGPLLQATDLVGATPLLDVAAAPVCVFNVATAGTIKVELTDLAIPQKLSSVQLVVSTGLQPVTKLSAAGSAQFDAVAGAYEVHVAGRAGSMGVGAYAVVISPAAGGAALKQCSGAVDLPDNTDPTISVLQTDVTIANAGMQQVTLTDTAFPAALASANLIVLDTANGSQPAGAPLLLSPPATTATTTFNAHAGSYRVIVIAQAQNAGYKAGLYGLKIADQTTSAVAYAASLPVGVAVNAQTFIATADPHFLRTADPVFPEALTGMKAAATQSGQLLASMDGAGDSPAFTPAAGNVTLYSVATPSATAGVGAYIVQVRRGTNLVFSKTLPANAVTSAPGRAVAYTFSADVATAGSYKVVVSDFGFPAQLLQLQALAVQNGSVLGTATAAMPLTTSAVAGSLDIIAYGKAAASSTGLFRLTVNDAAGMGTPYESVQSVGSLFRSRFLAINTAESYDATLADLGFTANFSELAVAVTKGDAVVGQIFGGGKFSFQATPGSYYLNLIAQTGTNADYGLYGVRVETTPSPTSLNFTASAASVASGQTVVLTWSAMNATSCTATGGWTGTRAATGSEQVGPITGPTTYTLNCSGAGGSQSKSVDIAVTAPKSSGGGGGFLGLEILATLGSLLAARRRLSLSRRF
jgi:hypothetical protein